MIPEASSENCVALLRRPSSAASNSSLSATAYVPVTGGHSGKHATRLRLRRLGRPSGLSYASSAISPQRSRAANFQLASLRNDLYCVEWGVKLYSLTHPPTMFPRIHQPSLAACSWAYQVKSCSPGVQGLPWPVHLRCQPSKLPRASLFLQRLPRSASGSPLHCWQPSIFGCWIAFTANAQCTCFQVSRNVVPLSLQLHFKLQSLNTLLKTVFNREQN